MKNFLTFVANCSGIIKAATDGRLWIPATRAAMEGPTCDNRGERDSQRKPRSSTIQG